MNKWIVIIMAFGMIWVSGCGSSEKTIEGEVQNVMAEGESAPSQGTEEGTEHARMETESPDHVNPIDTKGYVFTVEGTVVGIDDNAAAVIALLGEPLSYFEAPSCAFEGLDKIYTYNGFEIDTYPMGDMDYISEILFKDDSVVTTEGVGIGDSMEKLEQTYGSEYANEDGMIVYSKDDMKLCFILRDEEIISIEYRTMVLD